MDQSSSTIVKSVPKNLFTKFCHCPLNGSAGILCSLTGSKHEQISILKKPKQLEDMDDDQNIFQTSLIDCTDMQQDQLPLTTRLEVDRIWMRKTTTVCPNLMKKIRSNCSVSYYVMTLVTCTSGEEKQLFISISST